MVRPWSSTSSVAATEVVDRGDPADELFGGDLDVGPVLEELPLVGSVGEFEQGTRDDGAGGFGAAVEQQQAVGDDLVEPERLAADFAARLGFDRDPLGHHVVHRAAVGDLGFLGLVELGTGTGELHGRDDALLLVVARATAERDRGLGPCWSFGHISAGSRAGGRSSGRGGSGEFGHDLPRPRSSTGSRRASTVSRTSSSHWLTALGVNRRETRFGGRRGADRRCR